MPASPVLLTSPSDAPLFRPCIQLLMLQVAVEHQMALLEPWSCPGPLALVFFSMTASAIAWQPSCKVFVVTSTCTVLPGPINQTPQAEFNVLCISIGKPLSVQVSSKEEDCFPPVPGPHGFSDSISGTGFPATCQQIVQSTPCMGR